MLVTVGLAVSAAGAEAEARLHELTQGQLLLDAGPEPPPDADPRWRPVTLPDAWHEQRFERGGAAWYRFRLPGPAPPGERWALYLPRVNMNAEALVNGQPVGSGGSFALPVARNNNRPLLFVFPSALLARESNTIDVRLYAYARDFGMLAPIAVGPEVLLRPRHDRRRFLQTTLSQLGSVITLFTAVAIGVLWFGTRFDAAYGCLVLMCLSWTVPSFNYWMRDIPVSHWTWVCMYAASIAWFSVTLACCAHRFVEIRRPRLERALLGYGLVASLIAAALPAERVYPAVNGLHAISLGIACYALSVLVTYYRRMSGWVKGVYVVTGLLSVVFGVYDVAVVFGFGWPDTPYMIVYAMPLLVFAFGCDLAGRFVVSLGTAERLNRELEGRVQEKQEELESHYQRLHDLEQERLLSHERERIMREMHDGLGGQLVSALSMVERGRAGPQELATTLRGALDEMRIVIDSLDPKVGGLAELLGMLRVRLEPLLRRNGLKLSWKVGQLPPTPGFGPDEYLHVLRIVQETMTNVVKHARAQQISLSITPLVGPDPGVAIAICDDGCGFDEGASNAGRGLRNMRDRARELGGELRIHGTHSGTTVELRLPLEPPD